MDRRERVIRAVEMNMPDRVPVVHSLLPAALLKHGKALVDLLAGYPNDFGSSEHTIPEVEDLPPSYRAGRNADEWGTVWVSSENGIHGQVADHPIHSWEEAEAYQFPPLPTEEWVQKTKRHVAKEKRDRFVTHGFMPSNYFERLHFLLGFRTVLKCLLTKPRGFVDFADRLLEHGMASLQLTLDAEPDSIGFGDDWGAQDRLLIRPDIWRSFFKPKYKKMFDLAHDHGAYVQLHSDGYIVDILDDLYEIGVNVLNPQFSCHDLHDLADRTRGKLCINSDIDRQYVLPHASPEEVDAHIGMIVDLFGRENGGGLFGRGELNRDVPLANCKALFDAWMRHGRYAW